MQCKGACGLVQLRHSYDPAYLYGEHYGYRSGLNRSMIDHLQELSEKIQKRTSLQSGDLVVDIGSNDGTFLKFFSPDLTLLGIDPTAEKFARYYPPHIRRIPQLFSSDLVPGKAKVVTAIAMIYDLESPLDFLTQVVDVLADDGVFLCEQSELSSMVSANAYDTICHEHIEYYALKQLQWMFDRVGLKIIDVEFNDTNGGSVCVMGAKKESAYGACTSPSEPALDLHAFRDAVQAHREQLRGCVDEIRRQGKTIFGYGASTKGNVLLQFCGFSAKEIPYIAEINEDKFGCVTPGTHIPIIPEKEAKEKNPDYFLVLPWHFRENIVAKNPDLKGKLLFPLPNVEVI